MIENDNGNSQFLKDCETDWNLNIEFIHWLNYWFKEYKKKAKIDLTYHKFEYKNKKYTQKEIINKIIKLTDKIIKDADGFWNEEVMPLIDETFELFHLVFYAMWW